MSFSSLFSLVNSESDLPWEGEVGKRNPYTCKDVENTSQIVTHGNFLLQSISKDKRDHIKILPFRNILSMTMGYNKVPQE